MSLSLLETQPRTLSITLEQLIASLTANNCDLLATADKLAPAQAPYSPEQVLPTPTKCWTPFAPTLANVVAGPAVVFSEGNLPMQSYKADTFTATALSASWHHLIAPHKHSLLPDLKNLIPQYPHLTLVEDKISSIATFLKYLIDPDSTSSFPSESQISDMGPTQFQEFLCQWKTLCQKVSQQLPHPPQIIYHPPGKRVSATGWGPATVGKKYPSRVDTLLVISANNGLPTACFGSFSSPARLWFKGNQAEALNSLANPHSLTVLDLDGPVYCQTAIINQFHFQLNAPQKPTTYPPSTSPPSL